MSQGSSIEWCDTTWNPVTGCSKVSAGCKNCYAETVAARFWPTQYPECFLDGRNINSAPLTYSDRDRADGLLRARRFTDVWTHPERLEEPLKWRKPRLVFVNSMSDLFHESVPDEFIDQVFAVMALCPQHTFQILTKRAERMRAYFKDLRFRQEMVGIEAQHISGLDRFLYEKDEGDQVRWPLPLPNVWLGVSVENQRFADERIPLLLQTPAAIRFVSYEPALGPVDLRAATCIGAASRQRAQGLSFFAATRLNWVIVGGESGPKARPCEVEWIRSVVRQCREAKVACFVKQLGAVPLLPDYQIQPGESARLAYERERADILTWPDGTRLGNPTGYPRLNGRVFVLRDRKGGDPAEWPEDLRVRQYPVPATREQGQG